MKKIMCIALFGLSMATFANATASAQSADVDKQFLATASQSDYTEIAFSKLAADKAADPQVKAFAQKMITDHTALETDMKPFADKWGVTPVTTLDAMHQQKYDALQQISGVEFDKAYMMGMDDDHHATLALFKQEESATTDRQFKKTVAKGEKVVAMHTKMADMAVMKMDKKPVTGM
jgi:putative membrane protein